VKIVILAAVLGTLVGVADATTAYNFTGHWTGSAQQSDGQPIALTADLIGTKTFTGTVNPAQSAQCAVKGTQAGKGKVVLHLTCTNGDKITVRARLTTTAPATIAGGYTDRRPHKHLKHGTLTLTKQA
jgi:hypothetical protein